MVLQLVERIRPHHKHSIARKSHLNCIAAYFIARKLDFAGFGITGHKVGRKLFFLLRGQFLKLRLVVFCVFIIVIYLYCFYLFCYCKCNMNILHMQTFYQKSVKKIYCKN